MRNLHWMLIAALLLAAPGCGGEEDEPGGGSDPASTTLPSQVSCASGLTVTLSDVAECKGYFNRWLKECCPKAPQDYTEQTMQAMLCTGVDLAALNQACKQAMSGFEQACSAAKSSSACQ